MATDEPHELFTNVTRDTRDQLSLSDDDDRIKELQRLRYVDIKKAIVVEGMILT